MSLKFSPKAPLLGALLLAVSPPNSVAQDVVINELMCSTTGTDTEFIELFNTTGAPIDLTNWTIDVYNSNDESTSPPYGDAEFTLTFASGSIPANGFFLLGSPEFQSVFSITPDVEFPNDSLPNNSFTMVLRDGAAATVYSAFLTDGGDSEASIVDSPNDAGASITPDVSVGPDGTFMPAGYYLSPNGGTSAVILEFSPKPAPSATPMASVDNDAPALLIRIPNDNAFLATAPTALVLGFNEVITAGTGNITLYASSDDSVIEAFDITSTSGNVEIVGPDVGFSLADPLPPGAYYVLVDPTAIEDQAGNTYEGISDPEVWNFSVAASAILDTTGPYTEDFSGFTSLETFPDGWTVEGDDLTYDGDWGTGTTGGFRGNASVLGYQHTGGTGVVVETLTVRNDTGATIENLTVSYNGRVARETETRFPAYSVEVAGVTVPSLTFSTTESDNTLKEASVTGLFIEVGTTFTITWTSDGDAPGSGSRRQIGISEVSVGVGATPLPPTVSPVSLFPETLTSTMIDVGSEVLAEGGDVITVMGFVFSETEVNDTPEIGETGVTNLINGETGVLPFFETLSGLTADTSYTVRSYATNSIGTGYSDGVIFTTLPPAPSFTGTYQEPFDAFDGSFPAGWTGLSSGELNSYGGAWGSGSSGGFRGGVSAPGVVGYQHTSSSGTLELKLSLVNNTGATITDLNFSYLGEVERVNEGRSPEWTVTLDGVEVPELAYSTSGMADVFVGTSLTGLSIAEDAEFTLIWSSDRGLPGGASKQIGLGEVIVSTSPIVADPYESWAVANGLTMDNDGAEFDAENDGTGDGIANVLEFILNGDPLAVDPSILPTMSVDETDFIFVFNRSEDSIGAASATFQWSTDLSFPGDNDVVIGAASSPADSNGVTVEVDDTTTPDTITVKVPRSNATTGKIFGRLVGTRP